MCVCAYLPECAHLFTCLFITRKNECGWISLSMAPKWNVRNFMTEEGFIIHFFLFACLCWALLLRERQRIIIWYFPTTAFRNKFSLFFHIWMQIIFFHQLLHCVLESACVCSHYLFMDTSHNYELQYTNRSSLIAYSNIHNRFSFLCLWLTQCHTLASFLPSTSSLCICVISAFIVSRIETN